MDTSTGKIYLEKESVLRALECGEIKRAEHVKSLESLPPEVVEDLVNKTRQERRTWYAENRIRANLQRFRV